MRYYLPKYQIPSNLIIIGGLMCIAASLEFAENYVKNLFWFGALCIFIGILGWIWVQVKATLARNRNRGSGGKSSSGYKGRFR